MVKLSAPVAVCGMVFFGTMCSLLAKLIYSVEAPSRFGGSAPFEKPWFQVLAMFLGMSICIVLDLPKRDSSIPTNDPESQALLPNGITGVSSSQQQHSQSVWIVSLPTLFDLFATACGTTGLLYTTVSVYQMLRGAMLVWTALLSVIFLRRRLTWLNCGGITLCVVGIALVGAANIAAEGPGKSRKNVSLGVIIILIGQVLQAAQVVMEEFLLQDLQMSSVRIVAWEGLFGVAHCLLWVFPLLMFIPGRDHGRLEDFTDALYMLFHSWKVAAIIATDMTMMLFYNVCGMEVTENLSAVHRVVIETLRTLCVWVADLFIYYVISNGRLGEKLTVWSSLQLVGFAFLIAGTLTYNFESLVEDYKARAAAGEKIPMRTLSNDGPVTTVYDAVAAPVVEVQKKESSVAVAIDGASDDEEEDEDGEQSGSFIGHLVGSASHGSYLLAGTPASYSRAGHMSSSLRQRHASSAASPRSPHH